MTAALDALGRSLASAGLTARALAAWAGTAVIARLPGHLPAARTPAARLLALFVAGAPLAVTRARDALGDALDGCLREGLLERRGDDVVSLRAVVPAGQASFVVCDPLDAPPTDDPVPWPDDSSYHLRGALQGTRAARWLDLGTGSGVAPLLLPRLAPQILGGDISVRTACAAALGAALSGQRGYAVTVSDLDAAISGTWDLISCNSPIPDAAPRPADTRAQMPARASRWHRTDALFLQRLAQAITRRLAPGGLAVLHTALDPLRSVLRDAGGDAVSVMYTPNGHQPFAVTWWQPHLPPRHRVFRRDLTPARPHIDGDDRRIADDPAAIPLPDPRGS